MFCTNKRRKTHKKLWTITKNCDILWYNIKKKGHVSHFFYEANQKGQGLQRKGGDIDMVEETIRSIKETEAQAEQIVKNAQEQCSRILDEAAKEAGQWKEEQIQQAKQKARQALEEAKTEGDQALDASKQFIAGEIQSLKEAALQKEEEAVGLVISGLV